MEVANISNRQLWFILFNQKSVIWSLFRDEAAKLMMYRFQMQNNGERKNKIISLSLYVCMYGSHIEYFPEYGRDDVHFKKTKKNPNQTWTLKLNFYMSTYLFLEYRTKLDTWALRAQTKHITFFLFIFNKFACNFFKNLITRETLGNQKRDTNCWDRKHKIQNENDNFNFICK